MSRLLQAFLVYPIRRTMVRHLSIVTARTLEEVLGIQFSPREVESFRFGPSLLAELFLSPNDTTIQNYDGHLWGRDLLYLAVGLPLPKCLYLNLTTTLLNDQLDASELVEDFEERGFELLGELGGTHLILQKRLRSGQTLKLRVISRGCRYLGGCEGYRPNDRERAREDPPTAMEDRWTIGQYMSRGFTLYLSRTGRLHKVKASNYAPDGSFCGQYMNPLMREHEGCSSMEPCGCGIDKRGMVLKRYDIWWEDARLCPHVYHDYNNIDTTVKHKALKWCASDKFTDAYLD